MHERTGCYFLRIAAVFSAVGSLLIGPLPTHAQIRLADNCINSAAQRKAETEDADASRLNVNAEHQKLLLRADELVREGRFDLASTIWQRILDEGTGTLMTRDQWQTETSDRAKYRRFKPVASEVQQTISRLPPQGLNIYRASADAEARAIIAAEGSQREVALSEVVRRYFLSSLGDDAALELASRSLDRHDFVGAIRLLNQIDSLYPDPSVSRGEVLLRLAAANAFVGDMQNAQNALARIEKLETGRPVPRLVEAVRAGTQRPALAKGTPRGEGWPMRLGTAAGDGRMAMLPATYTAAGLSDGWFDELLDMAAAVDTQPVPGQPYQAPRTGLPAIQRTQSTADRAAMLERWQQSTRSPAGQLLVQNGQVFYKTDDRVACRDIATGKLKWLGWENNYQPVVPPMYQFYGWDRAQQLQLRQKRLSRVGTAPGLLSATEIQLLGDRVHASMSIVGDLLLAIEAVPVEPAVAARPGFNRFPNPAGPSMARQRENRLTAYEAATGKLKWVRTPAEKVVANEPGAKGGFLAAPVPFAKQVIVPLVENGAVWLASLDYASGRTTWRTMICEEPDDGSTAWWAPVGVAVDGGDVYVATGAGVVAALDALSGSIHWIALYPRKAIAANPNNGDLRRPLPMEPANCWLDDTVIARGSHLIVLPSDADEILALDRRSGELQWKTARAPSNQAAAAEYCLGVLDDCLYVAGPRIVRCYKIAGGGLKWEHPLSGSCGRGLLTEDTIYVPDKSEVVRLDPRVGPPAADPRELGRTAVITPSGEPVGNLVTDGRQLLVLGLLRVYALEGMESRLVRLAKRITDGDADARRERMRLYYRSGRLDEAIVDLESAYSASRPQSATVFGLLLDGMEELQLATTRPARAIELLATARHGLLGDAKAGDAKAGGLSSEQIRKQSAIVGSALSAIEKAKTPHVSIYLTAAEICQEEYLVEQLCRLMRSAVQSNHAEQLRQAARHREISVRRVAAAGLGKISADGARQSLVATLKDSEPLVRLAAAWELANRGEPACLPVLVELLKSDNPLIRIRAFSALHESTGQTLNYQPHAAAEARNNAADSWKKWLAKAGAGVKLSFPLRDVPLGLGRLLVASMGTNQIVEMDLQGREIWRTQVVGPFGVHGSPDGHRLVANYSARSIHEFNERGTEIWTVTELQGNPTCVQRLTNGNTLVVLSNRGQVIEIAPDKRIVHTQEHGPGVGFARRLENGNTLTCLPRQSQVVEFDRAGRQVVAFPAANATSARRLDNGNTLIAEQGRNRVVELSPSGQVVWSVDEVPGPWDVERLANGNTVISNSRGVEEFAPDGRKVNTFNYPSVYRISAY